MLISLLYFLENLDPVDPLDSMFLSEWLCPWRNRKQPPLAERRTVCRKVLEWTSDLREISYWRKEPYANYTYFCEAFVLIL